MISYDAKFLISKLKALNKRYYHFKKQSCDNKISNLALLFIKNGCIDSEIILILTYMVIVVLILQLILLSITFIFAIKYRFLNMQVMYTNYL